MMRRLLQFLCVLTLSLGSCSIQEIDKTAQPMDEPLIYDVTPTLEKPTVIYPTLSPTLPEASPTLSSIQITPSPSSPSDPLLAAGEKVRITTIQMLTETSGWAIGQQESKHDHILRTFDGGETWVDISPPQPLPESELTFLKATAYFFNNNHAWVIYSLPTMQFIESVQVWYTTNGGITWQISAPLSLTGQEPFFEPEQFSFINLQHGWLLVHVDAGMSHDYSELFSTTDGGMHWVRVTDPHTDGIQGLHNTGVTFADSQLGWVSKDNLGVMQKTFLEQTTDGGHSWEILALPAPNNFDWLHEFNRCITSEPTFLNQQAGIVLVNCIVTIDETTFDTKTLTYTYTTLDRGQSWEYTQFSSSIDRLFFIDDHIGWAFGRDIFKTTDGGLNWVFLKTVTWDGQFSFVDPLHGWAVASNDEEIALVNTEDGGKTWQLIEPLIKH